MSPRALALTVLALACTATPEVPQPTGGPVAEVPTTPGELRLAIAAGGEIQAELEPCG